MAVASAVTARSVAGSRTPGTTRYPSRALEARRTTSGQAARAGVLARAELRCHRPGRPAPADDELRVGGRDPLAGDVPQVAEDQPLTPEREFDLGEDDRAGV